jgi:MFS family permease
VCTLIGLTQDLGGLIAARIALGIAEAGLFPGFAYYLALWYRRAELAWRIALFYASTTAAGAFGGVLAYAITLKMDGVGGLVGWRWIFILEGAGTVVLGVVAFWGMQPLPEEAVFLSEKERSAVLMRLAQDREGMDTEFAIEYVKQGFKDWKSYLYAIIYLGCVRLSVSICFTIYHLTD